MTKQRIFLFIPLLVFSVLVVLFVKGLRNDPEAMPSALLDKPVPKFSLPRLENPQEIRTESIFLGKVSLLNVWATTCVVCRVEHPFLNKLKLQGINIIGLDYQDDTADALRWIAQLGNPYNDIIVDADGRLGMDLGVFGEPETYVIDKQGVIRYKRIGELNQSIWDETIAPIVKQLENQ